MWKKILVIVLVLAAIGVAYYLVWKQKRDKADRVILNGMTRDEFLKSMRTQWESEYRYAMDSYIGDGGSDWNRAIVDLMQREFSGLSPADYEAEYQRRIAAAVDWAWEQNPQPMDIEWARVYWLPKVVDNMGININDELTQSLLYKI